MVKYSKILIVCFVALTVGCMEFPNPFAADKVLAKVGDASLYMAEIEPIFTEELTAQDSIKLLESYVDMWVKKQLKVQQAEQQFSGSVADIEKMVDDYRNSLLTYKLDQYYVDMHMDTLFSNDELVEYYQNHKSDFVLDRAIVKGRIVKMPENYRQSMKIKELMHSPKSELQQDFMDMCVKNDLGLTEFNTWTDFSEILSHLPTSRERDYGNMLGARDVQELSDAQSKYLVQIMESRGIGDPVPIERVSDVIRRVIYNQRKQELIRTYEDSLYRSAVDGKKIVINVN